MYFSLLILLPINGYTPAVVTVTACGQFDKGVTLIPTQRDGVQITYGKHLYVINRSEATSTTSSRPKRRRKPTLTAL